MTMEDAMRQLYSHSYFGWTHKRGGWDCLRHNDILAGGSVPYMADVAYIPRNTMAHYPKKLMAEVMSLPGIEHIVQNAHRKYWGPIGPPDPRMVNYKTQGDINRATFDEAKYFDLADRILNYSRHHSTAEALVANMLRVIGAAPPQKRVLFISRGGYDYTEMTVMAGLAGLGISTTFVGDALSSLFQMQTDHEWTRAEQDATYLAGGGINGAGYNYGRRLPIHIVEPRVYNLTDPAIQTRIRAGEFDVAIIGIPTDGEYMYMADLVAAKVKFAFIEWRDVHGASPVEFAPFVARFCKYGPSFHREMSDATC
jgi:hypothetical protein